MSGAEPLFTTKTAEQIVMYIRAGTYPWVAAEACGVPRAVFQRWLSLPDSEGGVRFHAFRIEVMKAAAQARAKAEIDLREANPSYWLRYGPGRETSDQPGWSAPPRAISGKSSAAPDCLDDPEFLDLLHRLNRELDDQPGLRGILADLASHEKG